MLILVLPFSFPGCRNRGLVVLLALVTLADAFVALAFGEVDFPVCALARLGDGLGLADESRQQRKQMTD